MRWLIKNKILYRIKFLILFIATKSMNKTLLNSSAIFKTTFFLLIFLDNTTPARLVYCLLVQLTYNS